jgi:hypothetical protein
MRDHQKLAQSSGFAGHGEVQAESDEEQVYHCPKPKPFFAIRLFWR